MNDTIFYVQMSLIAATFIMTIIGIILYVGDERREKERDKEAQQKKLTQQ
jgi:hypothetical protein